MFREEREKRITELLDKNSAVTTAELVELFGVSLETVRKDLLSMEGRGLLTRVHGGAMKESEMSSYAPLDVREGEKNQEKRALAARALDFVSENDIIAIDAGSTAQLFAEALAERFDRLTVVTHSLDVLNALSKKPNFRVILIGGDYIKEENSFIGVITEEMFKSIRVRSAFICPTALSLSDGISDFNNGLASIQKMLLSISDEVFILADSGKFEKHALIKISDLKANYTIITDGSLPEELYRIYTEEGYKICK